MSRVFISYRRADSADVTGRLFEHLEKRLGEGNVFHDVDSIELGFDFPEAIAKAMDQCETTLVLIGSRWLEAADEHGKRRLDDSEDWVRREVEAALARRRATPPRMTVIPVLVGDAKMPTEEQLPESLTELRPLQAARLRPNPDFPTDVARLLRRIPGSNPPVVLRNLMLVLLLVGLVGFWLLRYSTWSSGFVASVTVGPLTVVAALLKVLREHRVRTIRSWIDEHLLLSPRTTPLLTSLIVLALVAFSFFGSVLIVTPEDEPERHVVIFADGEEPGEPSRLSSQDRYEVHWTTPWSPRRLVVRVSGLPERRIELSSWELESLEVPVAFDRPVVLVRCDSVVLADTAAHPTEGRVFRCRVTLGERVLMGPFTGSSFHVGCEKVELTAAVREDWNSELEGVEDEQKRSRLLSHWTTLGEGFPELELNAGDRLVVEILICRTRPGAAPEELGVAARTEVQVEDPASGRRFPQVLSIMAD